MTAAGRWVEQDVVLAGAISAAKRLAPELDRFDAPVEPRDVARVLLAQANLFATKANLDASIANAERARAVALAAGDRALALRAINDIARFYGSRRAEQARAAATQALAEAEELGDVDAAAAAHLTLAAVAGAWFESEEALTHANAALAMVTDATDFMVRVRAASTTINAAIEFGDDEQAIRVARETLHRFGDAMHFAWRVFMQALLAMALAGRGDADEATRLYLEVIEAARQVDFNAFAPMVEFWLGVHLADVGPVEAARRHLRSALPLVNGETRAPCFAWTSAVEAELGIDADLPALTAAVDDARARGVLQLGAAIDLIFAEIALWARLTTSGAARTNGLREARRALAAAADILPRSVFARAAARRLARAIDVISGVSGAVVAANDLGWLRAPDGRVTRFRLNSPLRRLLALLAAERGATPGRAIGLDALFAVGWPGESVATASRANRVYVAINTLRKAGLDAALTSTDLGWCLNPSVRFIVHAPPGAPSAEKRSRRTR